MHAAHRRERASHLVGRRALHQRFCRLKRTGSDAGALECDQPLLGITLFGDRVQVGQPGMQGGRREDERC